MSEDIVKQLRSIADRLFDPILDMEGGAMSEQSSLDNAPCPACCEPLSDDGGCWSCDWGPTS